MVGVHPFLMANSLFSSFIFPLLWPSTLVCEHRCYTGLMTAQGPDESGG